MTSAMFTIEYFVKSIVSDMCLSLDKQQNEGMNDFMNFVQVTISQVEGTEEQRETE